MFEASKAIGPVGVGLIAAGLATAGFGIAAYKTGELIIGLIGDAEDLADSLEPFSDAGVFAPVPADTQASIERFNDSMSGLSALASSLKLEVGGELYRCKRAIRCARWSCNGIQARIRRRWIDSQLSHWGGDSR